MFEQSNDRKILNQSCSFALICNWKIEHIPERIFAAKNTCFSPHTAIMFFTPLIWICVRSFSLAICFIHNSDERNEHKTEFVLSPWETKNIFLRIAFKWTQQQNYENLMCNCWGVKNLNVVSRVSSLFPHKWNV